MKVTPLALPDVLLIEPRVYEDERGWFFEAWQEGRYAREVSRETFVQDSLSVSRRGVVRGLHLQHPHPQGKLVTALAGAVFDVAVDLRRGSPTFGRWVSAELSAANRRQMWIPAGFAHGFQALADGTVFSYKCTDTYHPESERTVRYSDPAIGVPWPLADQIVSARDRAAPLLADLPVEALPAAP
jgi:dTDP-4-dehydrorhamnose 3,5-epimerase